MLKVELCSTYNDFAKLMIGYNFLPSITLPTRVTNNSATIIDNIFVRLPNDLIDNDLYSGNFITDLSDHLPNFCIIQGNKPPHKERPLVRLYSARNFNTFVTALEGTDLSPVYNSINVSYSLLGNILQSLHNFSFPLVRLSRKKMNDKP